MNSEHKSSSTPLPNSTNSRSVRGEAQDIRSKAGDAVSKLADAAQTAGQQAKATATSLASEANEKATGMMQQQITAGAEWVGRVAEATKAAANNLNHEAPKLSGLVREAADKVERFSRTLKDQSVEELYQSASDFTRRQPAVVFGSAALFGFFIFRLLKAESSPALAARDGGQTFNDGHRKDGSNGATPAAKLHLGPHA